ncbi:MAG: endonuclease/exonuclease/phosphatase family protein [Bdellovibrionales bacterium]|nr:endonuclease/exonuclease/phosphatase family protein [Bdellovibrionales bacterium]
MKIANILLALLVLCMGLSALGESQWFLDLFSHFMLQYAVLALLLAIFYRVKKQKNNTYIALIAFIYACIMLANVVDRRAPMVKIPKESERVRIFEFNTSGNVEVLKNWLPVHAGEFDVVVLLEAGLHFEPLLEQLKSQYPYQATHLENSPFGMAVLSRWEITENKSFESEGGSFQQYELKIKRPVGDEFLLYALHAPPPFAPQLANAHEAILGELSEKIHDKQFPAIVVGDLNTTPTSHRFLKLVKNTGLRDTAGISPWANTWPALSVNLFSLLGIRIDHCLVSNSFSIVERERLTDLGSDHLPIKCVLQVEK